MTDKQGACVRAFRRVKSRESDCQVGEAAPFVFYSTTASHCTRGMRGEQRKAKAEERKKGQTGGEKEKTERNKDESHSHD